MFDSLDEQMKKDERRMVSTQERMVRWAIVGDCPRWWFSAALSPVFT